MSGRRSRRSRPARAGRTTARDIDILRQVGLMRVASTRQIGALFFGDLSTCSRRLSVLLALGLLAVTVRDLSRPNLYTLTAKGLQLLVREGAEPDEFFVARIDRRTALDHTLAVGDLRVAFTLAMAERELGIDRLLQDHEILRLVGANPVPLVPDLFVARRGGDGATRAVLVEVDLAEETIGFFARTKGEVIRALATERAALFGAQRWRPVVVAPSLPRLRHLAVALDTLGVGELWWGTTFERLNAAGVLGDAFASTKELAALPRGATPTYARSLAVDLDVRKEEP